MENNNSIVTSNNFYGSKINNFGQSNTSYINKDNALFNIDEEPINNNYNDSHYLCTKCLKFPFIKLNKDKKNVRLTCSCVNNKKILIEDLFKTNSFANSDSNFFSKINININIENELMCKQHNKKFKGFSKFFLNNFCEDCDYYKNKKSDSDIIKFNDIKIEEKKIKELIEIINNNYDLSESVIKFEQIDDSTFKIFDEEKEKRFKKLITIILNDYKNYPNFIHFFNIKIYYIFSILKISL